MRHYAIADVELHLRQRQPVARVCLRPGPAAASGSRPTRRMPISGAPASTAPGLRSPSPASCARTRSRRPVPPPRRSPPSPHPTSRRARTPASDRSLGIAPAPCGFPAAAPVARRRPSRATGRSSASTSNSVRNASAFSARSICHHVSTSCRAPTAPNNISRSVLTLPASSQRSRSPQPTPNKPHTPNPGRGRQCAYDSTLVSVTSTSP